MSFCLLFTSFLSFESNLIWILSINTLTNKAIGKSLLRRSDLGKFWYKNQQCSLQCFSRYWKWYRKFWKNSNIFALTQVNNGWPFSANSARNYRFKVNNRNTKTRCEICSKLTIKTPEPRLTFSWCLYS